MDSPRIRLTREGDHFGVKVEEGNPDCTNSLSAPPFAAWDDKRGVLVVDRNAVEEFCRAHPRHSHAASYDDYVANIIDGLIGLPHAIEADLAARRRYGKK